MDCLNLSFSVLLPYNDGEDFYYQYINNTKFFSKSFKRYEIGFSYKNLFKTLPNLNPLIFLQRAWTENRKVDVSIELYEDNILICGKTTNLCISAKEIPELNRISIGNQIIKNNETVIYCAYFWLFICANRRFGSLFI